MPVVPLIVLGFIALTLRWLVQKARVTAQDVEDDTKGSHPGAHLPSVNPDVRDVVTPRSLAVDVDTERFRSSGPNAAGG